MKTTKTEEQIEKDELREEELQEQFDVLVEELFNLLCLHIDDPEFDEDEISGMLTSWNASEEPEDEFVRGLFVEFFNNNDIDLELMDDPKIKDCIEKIISIEVEMNDLL